MSLRRIGDAASGFGLHAFAGLLTLLFASTGFSATVLSTIDSGGGRSSSASVGLIGSLGEIAGTSQGATVTIYSGFIGQLDSAAAAPADTTPPTLAVLSPTDYQVFGAPNFTVDGTAIDASDIQSVNVNGAAAALTNGNWSAVFTLAAGTNTFTVIATDASANHNAATQTVHAVYVIQTGPPIASFTGSPTSGALPLTVKFTDTSTGAITSRAWDFGDGGVSAATNPSHVFNYAGVFPVSLTAIGPDGTNVLSRVGYIAVTNTNTTTDTVPPLLAVANPTDYQESATANISVWGLALDLSGIASVKVNGTTATISGGNWTLPTVLVRGTNTFTVVATDASASANTTTQIIHAVLTTVNHAPVFAVAPSVTNALLQVGNVWVVVATETNVFDVAAVDPDGDPLNYLWQFGDGVTNVVAGSSIAAHVYTSATCGAYIASVLVSDGLLSVSSNLNVAVACELTIAKGKLQLTPNFAKANADSARLTATLDLGASFKPLNQPLTVDIAGAQVLFVLDKLGRGKNGGSTCRATFTKPTKTRLGFWTLTITLNQNNWETAWAAFGLQNKLISKPGVVVKLPVAILAAGDAFATESQLNYTATQNKAGTAK